MAGEGYGAYYGALKKQKKIEWEKNLGLEAISGAGALAAFAGGQAKKAKTAWDDYETGYKELGGDSADIEKRGGFFKQLGQTLMPGGDKGFFQRPEGEVRIGAQIYDREKIQKAGSFLGSDAASTLNQDIRDQYLQRTAAGRDMTAEEITSTRESLRPKTPFIEAEYDVDEEFPMDGGIEYNVNAAGVPISADIEIPKSFSKETAWETHKRIGGGKSKYFVDEAAFKTGKRSTLSEMAGLATVGQDWATPPPLGKPVSFGIQGPDFLKGYQPNIQTPGSTITDEDRYQTARIQESQRMAPVLARQRADQSALGTTVPLPQDMSGINIASRHQQYLQRLGEGDKRMEETGTYSFARGGDFITNGPQKILVGDNPGGRERVTIRPLDSEGVKGYYGKKRNWLETLYENNRRRKKY